MDGVVRGGDTVTGVQTCALPISSRQLRGGGGGAEDAQALGAEAVDDAGDQGPFRADDGERHAFVAREREQAVDVGGGDVGVAAFILGRGAGVAGGDEHLIDARRLRQLPRQCVFASAGADDEEFHARISRNRLHQCRKWRTPVNTIAMSCSSAAAITSLSRIEPPRSAEHTSALQSLMRISYAVFCLKKKKIMPSHKTCYVHG